MLEGGGALINFIHLWCSDSFPFLFLRNETERISIKAKKEVKEKKLKKNLLSRPLCYKFKIIYE